MPRIVLFLICLVVLRAGPASGIGVEAIRQNPAGADVAVVFVHGLAGGPCSSFESATELTKAGERTYECKSEPGPRPRPAQIPLSWFTVFDRDGATKLPGGRAMDEVDLFTVSYTDAARGSMSVTDIGERLAKDDEFLKILDDYNNVLFVAHSMGGIVIRRAIVRLELSRQQARLDRIIGVALLGSPSEGAPLADLFTEVGCWDWMPQWIRSFLSRKFCWGKFAAQFGGAGWDQISDLRTLDGHNHLLQALQTDWGSVVDNRRGKPFHIACAHETVAQMLDRSIVDRLYTSTPGCLQNVPINATHTELIKPTGPQDDNHKWLRQTIKEALRLVEENRDLTWNASDPLGYLLDQIEVESGQDGGPPPPPGAIAEHINIRDGSTEQVRLFRLKPQTRPYGGRTYGALLTSMHESNPCLKVRLDGRRRRIDLWTESAVACPRASNDKRTFVCDPKYC
jgi:pimeloyl-ACP methyl ester carboxylesterase